MKSIAMFGYLRDGVGKASAKSLRNEGKVPCVLYGGNENINFSMYSADFKKLVYTPDTYKVKLDLDGKTYKAILKDIQFHPVNDSILHADFQEIHDDKEIVLQVPVKMVGNSVGVRAGGKLIIKSHKLKAKGLPANFPDHIEVNIENLEIGKAIKVGEVAVSNLTLLDSPNNPVVTVKTTRAAAAAAQADEKKK
ncbi:MAG: 50S ribosomal protein L25/general stress protein Ctc [Bacteroidia bacterium]|jgi:large subunit ribosomal protein L25|nr:50S ribosomal protein L25/general stress protein Ctc [Bacteroidia bacterium]